MFKGPEGIPIQNENLKKIPEHTDRLSVGEEALRKQEEKISPETINLLEKIESILDDSLSPESQLAQIKSLEEKFKTWREKTNNNTLNVNDTPDFFKETMRKYRDETIQEALKLLEAKINNLVELS